VHRLRATRRRELLLLLPILLLLILLILMLLLPWVAPRGVPAGRRCSAAINFAMVGRVSAAAAVVRLALRAPRRDVAALPLHTVTDVALTATASLGKVGLGKVGLCPCRAVPPAPPPLGVKALPNWAGIHLPQRRERRQALRRRGEELAEMLITNGIILKGRRQRPDR
jgi:hypothetical protein